MATEISSMRVMVSAQKKAAHRSVGARQRKLKKLPEF
jgi:hypothetical protein